MVGAPQLGPLAGVPVVPFPHNEAANLKVVLPICSESFCHDDEFDYVPSRKTMCATI